jgi:hypothetical protein
MDLCACVSEERGGREYCRGRVRALKRCLCSSETQRYLCCQIHLDASICPNEAVCMCEKGAAIFIIRTVLSFIIHIYFMQILFILEQLESIYTHS